MLVLKIIEEVDKMSEMEWNSKWDWENWVAYGPRKLQFGEWMVADDDTGSFNLFAGGGSSGSDGGHVSSAKSSISASTDSSTKDGMQTRNLRLSTVGCFSGNLGEKMDGKGTGVSPPLEASIGSVEPLIGLKLGKRTYFENSSAGGSVKGAGMPTPSTASVKKTKSVGQNLPIPRCIVEGCNVDLSTAKEYHRKHRVCETHSKCPKVVVGGLERRFCQQCSRFHNLAEFDEKKRSCRRRLYDHNARRRKPPQETIQFNSTRLMSPFYEGKQQMSFLLNNAPFIHSRNPSNNSWNNTCNSKFTLTKGFHLKADGDGDTDGQMHIPGIKLPHISNMLDNPNKGFLASKSSVPEASNPGSKGSLVSPNSDAAQEYRRALSLLSSNPWGSCGPESTSMHYPIHENGDYLAQPTVHAIPDGVPLPSSELWLTEHQSTQTRIQSPVTNSNFQEIQLFKTAYEADFYSNILN